MILLNYWYRPIYLLQLENRVFILLELLKPTDVPLYAVFHAVISLQYQLSYGTRRQP